MLIFASFTIKHRMTEIMGNKLLVLLVAVVFISLLGVGFYIGYRQVFGAAGASSVAQATHGAGEKPMQKRAIVLPA
jgi:hypothetical protein